MELLKSETSINNVTLLLITTISFLAYCVVAKNRKYDKKVKFPPHIPSTIPLLGHAISFGKAPIEFLLQAYKEYGPVFSFTMVGKTFTYLIGPDSSSLFFNSKNSDLNAEDVYSKLTTPVFGHGVAYDVPNEVFLEQKKMLKVGLNIGNFKKHIPIVVAETEEYFERWGKDGIQDLFLAFSELIILTASSCLHGQEIRKILDEKVAQLYWDLDGGFSHEAWLLPSWLPLPSFKRRDTAHTKIKQMFYAAINERRSQEQNGEDDMLQNLITAKYKDGSPLSDDEIAGMLIGLLLAGQHTSSTTSSWFGFFIAQHQQIQEALYEEQLKVFPNKDLNYDGLKNCQLLEACLKETLRLRPPIMTMMRMCRNPQTILGFTIPAGHQVCVSPTTNHLLPDQWNDPESFRPERFMEGKSLASDDKFSYIPFGAGRHRCIGESFAYIQIKSIWSILIRKYHFELVDNYFPEINYATMIHTPLKPFIKYQSRL